MGAASPHQREPNRRGLDVYAVKDHRFQMQALSDASLHRGWVRDVGEATVTLETRADAQIEAGAFMYVEISTAAHLVTFLGFVIRVDGEEIELHLTSAVETRDLLMEPRVRIHSLFGRIDAEELSFKIRVLDVSENGLGFASDEPLEVENSYAVELATGFGTVNLIGQVRYCRPIELGQYPCGARIIHIDRVSRARWSRVAAEG